MVIVDKSMRKSRRLQAEASKEAVLFLKKEPKNFYFVGCAAGKIGA